MDYVFCIGDLHRIAIDHRNQGVIVKQGVFEVDVANHIPLAMDGSHRQRKIPR